MASKVLVFDKLAFDPATNQFFQLILIDNTTSYSLYVKDVASPTNPSLASNLTSSGATPVIAPSGAGDVVGLGTTNVIPLWTDGPNSVIGDSVLTQAAGGVTASGKFTANNFDCLGSTAPNNGWTVPAANVVAFYTAGVRRASVNSSGVLIGLASTTTGALLLAHSGSAFLTTIQSGNALAARTYTWPTDFGAAGAALTDAAGNGTLSWVVPAAAGANTALSNLAAVAINTALLTGPGIVAAFTTTPAAVTASSTAGVGLTLTADAAVAGNVNNGAANGGDITITTGAAARLVSGNGNGGNLNLNTGAGIGTGIAGSVYLGTSFPGAGANAAFAFNALKGLGFSLINSRWSGVSSGTAIWSFLNNAFVLSSTTILGWVSTTADTGAFDTSFTRTVAGVITAVDWIVDSGVSRVSTQFDKTTDTALAAITGLSATLKAGRSYAFTITLHVAASAVGGEVVDLGGGTATATALISQVNVIANTTNVFAETSRQTTLTGASAGVAGDTAYFIQITGTITVNAAGTFKPRFAQKVANGTSSVLVGSTMILRDVP